MRLPSFLLDDCLLPARTIRRCAEIARVGDRVLVECSPHFYTKSKAGEETFKRVLVVLPARTTVGPAKEPILVRLYYLPDAANVVDAADLEASFASEVERLGNAVLFSTFDCAKEYLEQNRY